MLATIDLFSGIGGLSHALRGLVATQLFCEIERHAIEVLQTRFRDVPVWNDVRTLHPVTLINQNIHITPKIDMVMGGFPCVGFSTYGKLQGFEEAQSNLFYQLLRVVDNFGPRLVFMENVPNILNMGMREVCREFQRRGYTLRWCVVAARDLGAPHRRRRWFCMAVRGRKVGPVDVSDAAAFQAFDWSSAPPTMVSKRPAVFNRTLRYSLLGNAVVPDCVRWAFLFLASGLVTPPTLAPSTFHVAPLNRERAQGVAQAWDHVVTFPKTGTMDEHGYVQAWDFEPPTSPVRHPTIRLNPGAYEAPAHMTRPATIVPGPIEQTCWATPRASLQGACHFLTQRCSHDLNTQVRFADVTPNELRGGYLSPHFVEWMMGFPQDWTELGK